MFDGTTVCLHKANLPFHITDGVKWKRGRLWNSWVSFPLALCSRPTSVILQTEGSEKSFGSSSKDPNLGSSLIVRGFSGPVLSQANSIGIVGGVSALSTVYFLERLMAWSGRDGGESPAFIVCSDPELGRELALFREKSSIPYARLRRKYGMLDLVNIMDNLRQRRMYVENGGARCVVMPCHVSYAWFGEVSKGCSLPFLHVGDCVAEELMEAKLKPVETGSSIRIGILGPDPMLAMDVYQQKLQNQGFEVVLPDEATMEHTVIPAMEAMNRGDMEGARNLLRIAIQFLLVRPVNTIILASDELRGLLPPDDPLRKKCTDPMDALARCTARWARL